MAKTRPYFLVFKGETHIIDAAQAAQAVQHVVGADVSELRPARAAEVSAWVRAGKEIPIAGEQALAAVESSTDTGGPIDNPASDNLMSDRAASWLLDLEGFSHSESANAAWREIVKNQRMTLENFDVIRTAAPDFSHAIAPFGVALTTDNIDEVRAFLEDSPMTLADVVDAIEKRVDFEAGMSRTNGGEERMIGSSGLSAEQ